MAAGVTIDDVDDGPQVDPLGNLVAGAIAFFTGDGTYDSDDVYGALTGRHSDAAGKVPTLDGRYRRGDQQSSDTA